MKSLEKLPQLDLKGSSVKPEPLPEITIKSSKYFLDLLRLVWIKLTQSPILSTPPREGRQWCQVVASAMEGPREVSILEQFFRTRANR